MRFLVITHVAHKQYRDQWYAYAPYVREMNLWLKHVDEVIIVASAVTGVPTDIEIAYRHDHLTFNQIPAIAFVSIQKSIHSLIKMPVIFFKIFKACQRADHIHLRCPGNIGLIGCLVQIFFPKTPKTAKYAGNWDPSAKQPLSYRLQKWILSNSFLTKNMQVLVYGDWPNQTKNIKPFFTATYKNHEIEKPIERDYSGQLNFVFVGSLVEGKRPLLAVKIIEALFRQGKEVSLHMYGDGILKGDLKQYVEQNDLKSIIKLHGNQEKEVVKGALKQSHFLILASKSEGWPKAIAEALFFGTIPIATSISCVPYMLGYGRRGILIEPTLEKALVTINRSLLDEDLEAMSRQGSEWSQQFTLDYFEVEIKKLLVRP
ncbi:glycosyltransferase [Flavobacteriaceae bacterium XHP0103]|uniref:glycosyltransferase family 4 protein n=1 Tax=Marixanthotalea marina TaxID=2844359 RepID=UPI002989ADFA|nr:glycosyltransferase [Marixanthotalea marina]MBU3822724.1 glycosyltransferase [Marixanthotalea marina]